MEVQKISLNNANIRYNNANDSARVYDIEANFQTHGGEVDSVDSGLVTSNDVQLATFSKWDVNLNPSFQTVDVEEQCKVLVAINEFIASVTENVKTSTINI